MKAVVQRVSRAQVTVSGEVIGRIQRGILVLLGVAEGDEEREADELAEKIIHLRIFSDEAGKMNLSVQEVGGSVLVVSQFTLLGDTRKGRRPSYITAAAPDRANELYQRFSRAIESAGIPTATGRFAAHMEVELVNDGPVTLVLDTRS